MRSPAHIRRAGAASAAVLACVAFAAPMTQARPTDERGAPATTLDALSEQQVLASRGQGPPRPVRATGVGPDVELAAGAIVVAGVGALLAVAACRQRQLIERE